MTRLSRFLPLLLLATMATAATALSQPAPTPIPVSGRYQLAPGVHEFSCLDGQPPTITPPNRVICPQDAPTVTAVPTLTPIATATPAPIAAGYVETFDGTPAAP